MTDIISTVQKQDPGSELIHLYELEYSDGNYARFFAGLDDDLTVVQFRDSSNAAQDYTAIPLLAEGFDITSDGAYSRPEITIGNMGSVFSGAVGGLDYQDLIGRRITKITTFRKYLVGESGDSASAPGVALPKIVYIIDRIKSKNIISITFELSSPFDLAGMTLPRRVVVGNACSWRYKEGRRSLSAANRIGGCSWEGVFNNTGTSAFYVNEKDEYIMNFTNSEATAFAAGSKTAGTIYREAAPATVQRLAADGTKTANGGLQTYWQCLRNNSDASPSEGINYRRVHKYSTYSSSNTYYGYTDSSYNDYVINSGKLWRVRRTTQVGSSHDTLTLGKFWIDGDLCGKTLNSCKKRFQAVENSSTYTNSVVSHVVNVKQQQLPFGGFPGVKQER